jgi:cyclophilin family peptidyl-prolyl cis-trans isomerase
MVSTRTMGAATTRTMSRRRTTSVDKEHVVVVQRHGYHSETTSRSNSNSNSNNKSNRKLMYDYATAIETAYTSATAMYEVEKSSQLIMPQQKQQQQKLLPTFQSDEEEGESSSDNNSSRRDNNGGYNGYGGVDPDEHDSYSSSVSPTPSLEGNLNTKPSTTGNKSDNSDLESHSNHKRALHEAAELPISVLRGKRNNNNSILRNNSGHQRSRSESDYNDHHNDHDKNLPSRNSSESSLLDNEYMVPDMYVIAEAGEGINSPRTRTTATATNITTKIKTEVLSSGIWRIIWTKKSVFLLLVTGLSMLCVGLYIQSYATLSKTLDQVITINQKRQTIVKGHFDSIEKDMYSLKRKLLELDISTDGDGRKNDYDDDDDNNDGNNNNNNNDDKTSGLFDEVVAIKEKIRIESSRISSFEKYIQATSFRDATRKYGNGVLRVKLNLEFLSDRDNNNNGNGNNHIRRDIRSGDESDADAPSSSLSSPHVLVLEMAPLDLMPHSVYTFLEMVDAKLFDGCSFILNAMNIIKAAPLPYEKGSSVSHKVKAFARLGLDTVSFREYSPDFPHEQYTVGFAADGSPSFYINTENNTDQFSNTGEPCFAKIVSGFDTVEKMENEPVRSGMWYKKRIGIQKAMIL